MIHFSEHSELKLKHRNIEKSLVISTILHPDFTSQGYSDRKIAHKKFGKLYLKVVYIETTQGKEVITQHWNKKFNPEKL